MIEKNKTMLSLLSTIESKRLEIIITLILLAVSFGLYLKLGSVDMMDAPVTKKEAVATKEGSHSDSAADIASLLGPLEAKLKQNPNDGNGWALLARSYVEIGQHASSFDSFDNAIKLIQNEPQLLADYADAIAVVNGHKFNGKSDALIQKVLSLDPNHEKGLLLAGTSAFNHRDYKNAIVHWRHLLALLPTDSTLTAEVIASIAEANRLAGNANATMPIKKIAKNDNPIAETKVDISGFIKLAPGLASKVSPNDTLFIFAKAVAGPPMPIAAVKVTAAQLPYIYHLNDSNALNPKLTLSSVQEVVVVARISKDGDAIPKAGDLQGMSNAIQVGDVLQDIEIDQIVD